VKSNFISVRPIRVSRQSGENLIDALLAAARPVSAILFAALTAKADVFAAREELAFASGASPLADLHEEHRSVKLHRAGIFERRQ
jgi:hypothetical protein